MFEWMSLNFDAIVDYWEGRIDTIELASFEAASFGMIGAAP